MYLLIFKLFSVLHGCLPQLDLLQHLKLYILKKAFFSVITALSHCTGVTNNINSGSVPVGFVSKQQELAQPNETQPLSMQTSDCVL